jgi:hypothetical protein
MALKKLFVLSCLILLTSRPGRTEFIPRQARLTLTGYVISFSDLKAVVRTPTADITVSLKMVSKDTALALSNAADSRQKTTAIINSYAVAPGGYSPITPVQYQAEGCDDFRLDQNDGPFSHIPVMSQGDMGLCYAYAAAALVDWARFSSPPPKGDRNYNHHTSAFEGMLRSVAETAKAPQKADPGLREILVSKYGPIQGIQGGSICEAIHSWSGQSSCDEAVVLDRYRGTNSDTVHALDQAYLAALTPEERLEDGNKHAGGPKPGLLAEKFLDLREDWVDFRARKSSWDATVFRKKLESLVDQAFDCSRYFEFDPAVFPDRALVTQLIASGDPTLLLLGLLTHACKEHSPNIQPLSCDGDCGFKKGPRRAAQRAQFEKNYGRPHDYKEICPESDQQRVWDEINLSLNAHTPVGIGYCGHVLELGRAYAEEIPYCGGHAGVLIGRRQHPVTLNGRTRNKCQYLIRNSWGTSCNRYHPDWDCEGGNIWVDADVVERQLINIERVAPQ